MKIVLLLSLLFTKVSWAIPVVNENMSSVGLVMIYPDHQDPHHYYISPNYVTVTNNQKRLPNFSFAEYRQSLFSRLALVQMTVAPVYTQNDLTAAEQRILESDPAAKFSGLPFVNSRVDFSETLKGLIVSQDCTHIAGVVGQEASCSFVLNSTGRKVFLALIRRKVLVTTFNYLYSVSAMKKTADGAYEPFEYQLGIAARVDGSQLLKYPQLFH